MNADIVWQDQQYQQVMQILNDSFLQPLEIFIFDTCLDAMQKYQHSVAC